MASALSTTKSSVYESSPSIAEMEGDRRYRKTLKIYRYALQNGMMCLLEDLEDFPAPVLCSYCEVPVITRTKSERSSNQKYDDPQIW